MKRQYRMFLALVAFGAVPMLLIIAFDNLQAHQRLIFVERTLQTIAAETRLATSSAVAERTTAVITAVADYQRRQFFHQLAVMLALGAALAALAFRNARRTTRTLRALLDAWQRLSEGDFSVRLKPDTHDERDALIKAFNTTVLQLADHLQTRQALQLAHEIQSNFLPSSPDMSLGLDVAVTNMSCDDTGGDYVDIIPAPGGDRRQLLLAIGDVSGHGIGPALLMASARGALRAMSLGRPALAERAARLNRLVADDAADSGHFMTLFMAELNTADGTLQWVRAGHDPAYIFDPQTRQFLELDGPGAALGITAQADFETRSIPFLPGRILVMATDGIWEARNRENAIFGKKRLREVVRQYADQPAETIKKHIIDAVRAFRGSARQADDITLMVVKRHLTV